MLARQTDSSQATRATWAARLFSVTTWHCNSLAVASIVLAAMLYSSTGFCSDPEWKAVSLPTKPSDIDGFTCTIEVLNAIAEGYLPLKITATSTVGTFPGDRPIRLQLEPRYGNRPKPHTVYSASFTLPAGKSVYTETIYLPKYFEGAVFDVRLIDPAGSLKSYTTGFNIGIANNLKGPDDLITVSDWLTRIAVILPDPGTVTDQPWAAAPDLRSLDSMLEVDQNFLLKDTRLTDAEAKIYLKAQSRVASQLLTADKAHERWLGYESIDVIVVALPVLQSMRTKYPSRFEAIRDWVSCGGVLWTYGFNSDGELEKVFDVSVPDPTAFASRLSGAGVNPIDRAMNNYTPANRSSTMQFVMDPYGFGGGYFGQNPRPLDDPLAEFSNANNANHAFTSTIQDSEMKESVTVLPVEAGMVIGLKEEDPFPGSLQKWFVVKYLSGSAQHFQYRRGLSMTRGTSLFWEWLLNNVARPPVYAFLGFLSIFVLLVGPISYHFTRKAGRGYLMFIIAPFLAAFTTLLLFGYGFIADGFGTKVRVRQITFVDGESGRASEMNRSTYFSAFRPGSGLRFQNDAAVYPAEAVEDAVERSDYTTVVRPDRSIDISGSEQVFRGEFLPSRTQSQFLSYYPVRKQTGVRVDFKSGQWSVQNQFTATIKSAIVRLPNEQYCILEQPLATGESISVTPVKTETALSRLRELYREHQPAVPLGYEPTNLRSSNWWYNYSNTTAILASIRPFYVDTGDELGIYESKLRRYLFDLNKLPAGWFVATLEVEDSASAVPGASVLESVHYAMGSMDQSAVEGMDFKILPATATATTDNPAEAVTPAEIASPAGTDSEEQP